MKRTCKRLLAGALALLLVGLTGCSGKPDASSQPGGETAMGRYVETELPMPEGIGRYNQGVHTLPDGTLELIANQDQDTAMGPWMSLRSQDGGKTWAKADLPWLNQLGQSGIDCLAPDGQGGYYYGYSQYGEEFLQLVQEGRTDEITEDMMPTTVFCHVDAAGTVTELPYELPTDESGAGATGLQVAENGDLLVNCYFSVIQIDAATGEVKNTFKPEQNYQIDGYLADGDNLLLSDNDRLLVFSLTSGEKTTEIPCNDSAGSESGTRTTVVVADGSSAGRRVLAKGPDGSIYFVDSRGIFRCRIDGAVLEKMAEGELTSLNMPSLSRLGLVIHGESFLVFGHDQEEGYKLLSYDYSAEVPTVPTTELKVYALNDSKDIRQAMGIFQREHPDVHVNFQVGLSGDAVTLSDAQRSLSTELLAEKGPDLLVLDGLPIDSYVEKGVLLDLSGLVAEQQGALLQNIVDGMREDGKLYGLPMRFLVPMMQLKADGAKAQSVGELADWLEQHRDEFNDPVGVPSGPYLVQEWFRVLSPELIQEDGSIQREALTQFLSDVKRVVDLYDDGGEPIPYFNDMTSDFSWGSITWMSGGTGVNDGPVGSFMDLSVAFAARQKSGMDAAEVPMFHKNVYLPRVTMGINAASGQQELAKEFLGTLMSVRVQKNDFSSGFPVNAEAFEAYAANPWPEGDDGMHYSLGSTDETGEETVVELQVLWPTEEYVEQMKGTIRGLATASTENSVLTQMLVEETAGYFDGSRDLESTVSAVLEKMNLYLSE